MPVSFSLDDRDKQALGDLARETIRARLQGRQVPPPDLQTYSPMLRRSLGAFVTLNSQGRLRGCIGYIQGVEPLATCVWRMAQAAAFQDPRFRPVRPDEWPSLSMEITVLDQLSPCPDPSRIVIGRHGLVLRYRGRTGVFLPQVPVECGWDLKAYLVNLCHKAGVPVGSWQAPGAELFWYEGIMFHVPMHTEGA